MGDFRKLEVGRIVKNWLPLSIELWTRPVDPHGLNTTHVNFPSSTVTCRNTFFPPISVPTV
jgi:hypothetical protein